MDDMLKEALQKLKGPLSVLWNNLCGDDREIWLKELNQFLRKEPCWGLTDGDYVFSYLDILFLDATFKKFIAGENFAVQLYDGSVIMIDTISADFSLWFLTGGFGKTEDPTPKIGVIFHRLARKCSDREMITVAGGDKLAASNLSTIYATIKNQGRGQLGKLAIDGSVNIAFAYDCQNRLRTILLRWSGRGWIIDAAPIAINRIRMKGLRVIFSRS